MMKMMFDKATKGPVNKDALDFALSYVILFYEWHLDGPTVVFTRPLSQRTLLNWSGGTHYRLEEPGSIDLLEMVRTKFISWNKAQQESSLTQAFYMDHSARWIRNMWF